MLTQRLGSDTGKDERFIESLISALRENPGACDEVWFASDYGYPKLETHRETAQRIRAAADKFRAENIRVSLQISNTVGHGLYICAKDCSGLIYEGSPVEKMVGHDGTVAEYCFCWSGKYFQSYIKAMLEAYAALKPYCVWVDDDLRASNHHPVQFGCFCDDCIARFNRRYGGAFSRETLVKEINFGNPVWRERYVEFLRESLYDFSFFLAETVHAISPESFMGLQYVAHGGYTGFGFSYILDAFYEATGLAPKTRPGGGAYNGHNPNDFLAKAYLIGWQNTMLPDFVTEKRPEIENLPDVVYGKSPAETCFETSVYFACGNTAMSYAMIMDDYEPMDRNKRIFTQFSAHRPYWERLVAANKGTHPAGIRIAFSERMWKTVLTEKDRPFSWTNEPVMSGYPLWNRTGIPVGYAREDDGVFLLHPDQLSRFDDGEITALLKKPVLTDGRCLMILEERGFGALLGASAIPLDASMLYERFIDHPINAGATGNRTWRSFFAPSDGFFRLLNRDGKTEPFSVYASRSLEAVMTDAGGEYPYGVANALVTTAYGAKWAVFGYFPWDNIVSFDKRNQLLRAAEIIGGPLSAVLESPVQAALLPREDGEGKVSSVSVINADVGESEPLSLRIRRPAGEKFTFMAQYAQRTPLSFTKEGNDYLLSLPPVAPWSVATVFAEKTSQTED